MDDIFTASLLKKEGDPREKIVHLSMPPGMLLQGPDTLQWYVTAKAKTFLREQQGLEQNSESIQDMPYIMAEAGWDPLGGSRTRTVILVTIIHKLDIRIDSLS